MKKSDSIWIFVEIGVACGYATTLLYKLIYPLPNDRFLGILWMILGMIALIAPLVHLFFKFTASKGIEKPTKADISNEVLKNEEREQSVLEMNSSVPSVSIPNIKTGDTYIVIANQNVNENISVAKSKANTKVDISLVEVPAKENASHEQPVDDTELPPSDDRTKQVDGAVDTPASENVEEVADTTEDTISSDTNDNDDLVKGTPFANDTLAKVLVDGLVEANFLDELYQPAPEITKAQLSYMIATIAEILNGNPAWSSYEKFWDRTNLRQNYNNISSRNTSVTNKDSIDQTFLNAGGNHIRIKNLRSFLRWKANLHR